MGVADDLEKAAVLIAQGGHCKASFKNGFGCYCLMGALNQVAYGSAWACDCPAPYEPPATVFPLARTLGWVGSSHPDVDELVEAGDAAAHVIKANDGLSYCQEQAVADLNAAARLARGEANGH
jgi:hypothetical protein